MDGIDNALGGGGGTKLCVLTGNDMSDERFDAQTKALIHKMTLV